MPYFLGINNMTTKLRSGEVILYQGQLHFLRIMEQAVSHYEARGITLIFSTIPAMSIRQYNFYGKDHGRVNGQLQYANHYATMQVALERRLNHVNTSIIKLNADRDLLTPLLHRYILHNYRNGKKKHHFHLLYDGLHPTHHLIAKWETHLLHVAMKNLSNHPTPH